jgi:hypothetical protein
MAEAALHPLLLSNSNYKIEHVIPQEFIVRLLFSNVDASGDLEEGHFDLNAKNLFALEIENEKNLALSFILIWKRRFREGRNPGRKQSSS